MFFSGYQVQFHLVKNKTPDGLVLIDDDAYDPNLPSSRLVSKSEAQLSIEAKSFWLDFENGMLPVNIVIGQELLQGALKNGREYAVATVPYTVYMVSIHIQVFICIYSIFFPCNIQKQSNSVLLFTPSNLSAIFKTCKSIRCLTETPLVILSHCAGSLSSSNTALLDTSDPAELALIIALGVGLPLFLLGYLACFGVVIYCIVRRRRKKRMKKEYSRRYFY